MLRLLLSKNPSLIAQDHRLPLERKMAGILAWLALAGAQPRAKLAQTFWLDATSGRNNLRQALFKLRDFALFSTQEPLALLESVKPEYDGVLLEGLEYSDCPVFDEWLLAQRALEETKHLSLLEAAVRQHIEQHNHTEALAAARAWSALEPFSEEALRVQMRLLFSLGEIPQALALHQQFCSRLAAEWNLLPSPQTQSLLAELQTQQAEHWQQHALELEQQKQFQQAAESWQHAARFFQRRESALLAWHRAFELQLEFAPVAELKHTVQQIEQLSQSNQELARAALAQAKCAYAENDFALAARAARLGLAQTQEPELCAQLENELASALLRLDRVPEALAAHARALVWLEGSPNLALTAETCAELALAQANADLHHQAQANFQKADALCARLGRVSQRVTLLGNLAMSQRLQGDSEAALQNLLLAQTILQGASGAADEVRYLLANRGEIHLWREEYNQALADLRSAQTISQQNAMPMSFVWFRLAHLFVRLGAFAAARQALENAEQTSGVLERGLAMAGLLRGRIQRLLGKDPTADLNRAETLLEGRTLPSLQLRLTLERLAHQPDKTVAQAALKTVQDMGLGSLEPLAWLRLAQATHDAAAVQQAWRLCQCLTPLDCPRLEVAVVALELGQPVGYLPDLRQIPPEFLADYKKSPLRQRYLQLTLH